jgi:hypothetical protein
MADMADMADQQPPANWWGRRSAEEVAQQRVEASRAADEAAQRRAVAEARSALIRAACEREREHRTPWRTDALETAAVGALVVMRGAEGVTVEVPPPEARRW